MIEDVYLVFTYWQVTFNFNFSLCNLPGQFGKLRGVVNGSRISSSFVRHSFYSNCTYFKYNYDVNDLRI